MTTGINIKIDTEVKGLESLNKVVESLKELGNLGNAKFGSGTTLGTFIDKAKKGVAGLNSELTSVSQKKIDGSVVSGLSSGLQQSEKKAKDLNSTLNNVNKANFGTLKSEVSKVTSSFLNLKNVILAVVAGSGVGKIVEMSKNFDSLNRSFTAIAKSPQGGADEMAFVRAEAQRLGQDLLMLATSYKKLAASATGSKMSQEQVRALFSAVGEASTVLGLTESETERTLLALQQMMSKGTVSMEELRLQMGDSLPGAFQAAAKAMNMTEAELTKMISTGKLLSDDFLPKFTVELQRMYGAGFAEASKSARADFSRFGNTVKESLNIIGSSGVLESLRRSLMDIGKYLESEAGIKTLRKLGETISFVIDNVGKLVLVLAVFKARTIFPAVVQSISELVLLNSTLVGVAGSSKATAIASKGLATALAFMGGPIGLIVTALAVAGTAVYTYNQHQEKLQAKILENITLFEKQSLETIKLALTAEALAQSGKKGGEVSKKWNDIIGQALILYPELGTEIKALGVNYEGFADLLNKASTNKQSQFFDEQKKLLVSTYDDLNRYNEKIDNLAKARAELPNKRQLFIPIAGIFPENDDMYKFDIEQVQAEVAKAEMVLKGFFNETAIYYAEVGKINNQTLETTSKQMKATIDKALQEAKIDTEQINYDNFLKDAEATLKVQFEIPPENLEELKQKLNLSEILKLQQNEVQTILAQFGKSLDGAEIFDIMPLVSKVQQSENAINKFFEETIKNAEEAREKIGAYMETLAPDSSEMAEAQQAYAELTANIASLYEELEISILASNAKIRGEEAIANAERESEENLTAEAKKALFADVVTTYLNGETSRTISTKEANIAVQEHTLATLNSMMAGFHLMALVADEAGRAMANAMSLKISTQIGVSEGNLNDLKKDLEKYKNSVADTNKKIADNIKKGLGGSSKKAGKDKKKAGGGGGKSATDEALEAFKFQSQEELKMLKFTNDQYEKEAKKLLRSGELEYKVYLNRKVELAKEFGDLELKNATKNLSLLEAKRNSGKKEDADKLNREIIKTQNDLQILQAKVAENIEKSYTQAFDNIADEHKRLNTEMQQQMQTVQLQIDAGILSKPQGQRTIKAITDEFIPKLQEATNQFREMIGVTDLLGVNVDDLNEKLSMMEQTNLRNKIALEQTAHEINAVVEDAFTNLFDGIIDGTKSVADMFKELFKTILQGIAKIAAQNLIGGLMGSFGGSGGGLGGLLGGLLGGFASGGEVKGAGNGTSDSILARLSHGEYVIKAKAVKRLGTPLLNALNSAGDYRVLSEHKKYKDSFASGGMVNIPSVSSSNGSNSQKNVSINVGSTIDVNGVLTTWLKTDAFDRAIGTYLNKNGAKIRKLIRS